MKSRRKAREAALQALYQCDTLCDWSDGALVLYFSQFQVSNEEQDEEQLEIAHNDNHEFARTIIDGVRGHLQEIDTCITSASTHWSLSRMSRVDRNILRASVFELVYLKDIPLSVVINEAIEIAKRFGCDDSPMFINGVLDHIARTFREEEAAARPAAGKKKVAAVGE